VERILRELRWEVMNVRVVLRVLPQSRSNGVELPTIQKVAGSNFDRPASKNGWESGSGLGVKRGRHTTCLT